MNMKKYVADKYSKKKKKVKMVGKPAKNNVALKNAYGQRVKKAIESRY